MFRAKLKISRALIFQNANKKQNNASLIQVIYNVLGRISEDVNPVIHVHVNHDHDFTGYLVESC